MRRRRDPFARETLVPVIESTFPHTLGCSWCGQPAAKRRPLYMIQVDRDASTREPACMRGVFCSWDCAEAYTGGRLAR
jgi:hypothetical protein